MSYVDFPPLQLAASYNLQQVVDQVRNMHCWQHWFWHH
jgi:hypothetical protein